MNNGINLIKKILKFLSDLIYKWDTLLRFWPKVGITCFQPISCILYLWVTRQSLKFDQYVTTHASGRMECILLLVWCLKVWHTHIPFHFIDIFIQLLCSAVGSKKNGTFLFKSYKYEFADISMQNNNILLQGNNNTHLEH